MWIESMNSFEIQFITEGLQIDKAGLSTKVGRSSQDWGCPAGESYQGAFAQPPTALLHVPPQSGSPTWGKGAVAASSTLLRVLP